MPDGPKTPFKATPPATLTRPLIRFCQIYAARPNLDHAAAEAGISMGRKKFLREDIQKYIADLMDELKEQDFRTAAEVIREIEKMGFAKVEPKRIRASDKAKALEMLAKRHGIFEKDNAQQAQAVLPPVIILKGLK